MRTIVVFLAFAALAAPHDPWDIPGYTFMENLGNTALSPPRNCKGEDTYLGNHVFTDGNFDVAKCAALCSAKSAPRAPYSPSTKDQKHCVFFNTYMLYKNEQPVGQYCSMFTQAWDSSCPRINGKEHYNIGWSFTYRNATDTGDPITPADIHYLKKYGEEFCTSFNSYHAPKSTVYTTNTPAVATTTLVSVTAETSTSTVVETATTNTPNTSTTTATVVSTEFSSDFTVTTATVTSTPPLATTTFFAATTTETVTETETVTIIGVPEPQKRTKIYSIPAESTVGPSTPALNQRAVQTPAPITCWPLSKICKACSQVATGTITTTSTITNAATTITVYSTSTTTSVVRVTSTTTTTVGSPTIYATVSSTTTTTTTSVDTITSTDLQFADTPFTTVAGGTSTTTETVTTTVTEFPPPPPPASFPAYIVIRGIPNIPKAYLMQNDMEYYAPQYVVDKSSASIWMTDMDNLLFSNNLYAAQNRDVDFGIIGVARRSFVGGPEAMFPAVSVALQPNGALLLQNVVSMASTVQVPIMQLSNDDSPLFLGSFVEDGYTPVQLFLEN